MGSILSVPVETGFPGTHVSFEPFAHTFLLTPTPQERALAPTMALLSS
jgi:hypothetical protein